MARREGCSVTKLAALALVLSALSAQLAAQSPTESADGIAGAKRDLESIKTAAAPGALGTGRAVPKLDLPSLNLSSADAPVAPRPDVARRQDSRPKPGDWVVAEPNDRRGLRSGVNPRDEHRTGQDRAASGIQSSGNQSDRDAASTGSPLQTDPAKLRSLNPLTPFLAGWISNQDYRLLAAPREQERGALQPGADGGEGRIVQPNEGGATMGRVDSGLVARQRRPSWSESTMTAQNPYLEIYSSPLPAPRAFSSGSPIAPASAASSAIAPLTPTDEGARAAGAARVPEFVRSTADDKYYKPLKRF